MNDKSQKHWGDTEFGQFLGVALIFLAILLGIGGCARLAGGVSATFKDPTPLEAK